MTVPRQTISVLPLGVDLVFTQGDDFRLDVTVLDGTGAPLDCTNATPAAQVRLRADTPDPPLAAFVITVDASSTNVLHAHLLAADSAKLPLASVWDLQIEVPDVVTLIAGNITAQREVTR